MDLFINIGYKWNRLQVEGVYNKFRGYIFPGPPEFLRVAIPSLHRAICHTVWLGVCVCVSARWTLDRFSGGPGPNIWPTDTDTTQM